MTTSLLIAAVTEHSSTDYEPLSSLTMLIGLAGGLALFLHGMTMMSNALRAMAGSRMKEIIAFDIGYFA